MLFGLFVGQFGRLEIVGADQSLLIERLVALVVGLLVIERALEAGQIGFGRIQLANQIRLVQFGNNLSFLDDAVVVYIEFADNARDLCTYGDRRYWLDGSRGCDAVLNVGWRHLGRLKSHFFFLLVV